MKRWLYIFLLVSLVGCQSAEAIPTETAIANTATQVLTSIPTASPSPTSTLTPIPTLTPTPKPCPTADAALVYKPPEDQYYEIEIQSIENFLSAGGDSQQLTQYYEVIVEELNADTVPEILIQPYSLYKRLLLFSCINGEYKEQLIRENQIDIGLAEHIEIMTIDDLNKNDMPELVYKTSTCMWSRCGQLFAIEWDGEKFSYLIKNEFLGKTVDYADMGDPQETYIKDFDGDGIQELVWTGELPPKSHGDYWNYYPLRLAIHIYKWDGKNYSALPVSYSSPEFRFQAIQDGDRATLAGDYEKAVGFYELAVSSNSLDWWVEERCLYNLSQHGFTTCDGSPCPSPNPNPKERPILSAYARFRIMLIHVLTNDLGEAEKNYRQLLLDFPIDNAGYPIAEMATLFWNEYLTSKDISKACGVSVNFIGNQRDVLILLRGNTTSQNIHYDRNPNEVCPFQQ